MQALQTKSNIGEMFNIQEKENGEIAISGRELHQALEVKTAYKDWFPRMLKYGFEEKWFPENSLPTLTPNFT
ncbi:hypothetical protein O761_02691 [Staphylococcus aureus M0432]|nr:hypothetical protein O761_02691 [Staphylococcus aureus M0432]